MERAMNHPDDLTLLALAEGDQVDGADLIEAHLSQCDECLAATRQLRALSPDVTLPPLPIPASLKAAMNVVPPEPNASQLWRCEWGDIVQLVYLMAVDSETGRIEAAPIVEPTDSAGEVTVIDAEVLGWSAVVQKSLTASLPARTLDLYLGDATDHMTFIVEPKIVSPVDTRAAALAAVEDAMALLADAQWVPTTRESSLTDILQRTWPSPTRMAADTGIDASTARALLRGQHVPNDQERTKLSDAGVPDTAAVSPPSLSLLAALDSPQIRPLWRQDAARRGTVDSASYRWEQYTDNRFALAARSTGRDTDDVSVWLDRVREVLGGGS